MRPLLSVVPFNECHSLHDRRGRLVGFSDQQALCSLRSDSESGYGHGSRAWLVYLSHKQLSWACYGAERSSGLRARDKKEGLSALVPPSQHPSFGIIASSTPLIVANPYFSVSSPCLLRMYENSSAG